MQLCHNLNMFIQLKKRICIIRANHKINIKSIIDQFICQIYGNAFHSS